MKWKTAKLNRSAIFHQNEKKLRGRELAEEVNFLTEAPTEFNDLPVVSAAHIKSNASNYVNCLNSPSSSESSADNQEILSETESCDSSSSDDSTYTQDRANDSVIHVFVSSPLKSLNSSCMTLSSINELSSAPFSQVPENSSPPLFDGSKVCLRDASTLLELFSSHFSLSDEASTSIHNVIRSFLPDNNLLPTGYAHIQKITLLK